MVLRVVRLLVTCGGLLAAGCGSTRGDENGQGAGVGGASAGGFASGAGGGAASSGAGSSGGASSGAGSSGGASSGAGSGGGAGIGEQSSAGEQAGGAAGSAGTNAAGASAGAATFPARPVCGGSITAGNERWCVGIENVTLSKGKLTDASGDGLVSPGEEASVDIIMRNDGPDTYDDPCIGLLADNPAVTIVGGEAPTIPRGTSSALPLGKA